MGVGTPIPTGVWDISDPGSSRPWSPLAEITSPQHAAQVAMAFLGEVDPMDHQKFFAERDHRWLRGLLWLTVQALGNHVHPSVVYKAIISPQLLASLVRQAPHAAHEVIDLAQHSPADYAKVTAGLANRLSWLADPALATMLDGQHPNAFTLDDALASGVLLIVGARESGGERSAAAAAILLNLLRLKCLDRFGHSPTPVFWTLDEAHSYARRIQLAQMLDLLRGAHSPVCVGLQDVNQLGSPAQQTRMLTNCDTFITLAGVSSDTARHFSNRLGAVKAPAAAMAQDQSGAWRPTISHQDRPLLGEREIMYPAIAGQYGGVAQLRSGSPYPFLFSLG
jgi:type IV secretory pathway TraG/TraD family ATPase VirD4